MIEPQELPANNTPWIQNAIAWRVEHADHVERLELEERRLPEGPKCYPPCVEDKRHPELWKAASWVWLHRYFSDEIEQS